jgi:hypothetical protein
MASSRLIGARSDAMTALCVTLGVIAALAIVLLPLAIRILKQYERGVQFRLGRLKDGPRGPGLIFIIPARRSRTARVAADRDDADPVVGDQLPATTSASTSPPSSTTWTTGTPLRSPKRSIQNAKTTVASMRSPPVSRELKAQCSRIGAVLVIEVSDWDRPVPAREV